VGTVCMIRSPFYRVELRASDGDWLVAYMPIKSDGRYDGQTPGPHLVKAGGSRQAYGELVATRERYHRIVWGGGTPDSLTELALEPVRVGLVVRVFDGDDRAGPHRDFTVREMIRV
jgi:hypothetical protein